MINILIKTQSGLQVFSWKYPFKKPQEVLSTEKRGGYLVEEVWEQLHPTQAFLKGFTIHIRSLENRTDLKTSQELCLSQHFQIYLIN